MYEDFELPRPSESELFAMIAKILEEMIAENTSPQNSRSVFDS